MDGFRSLCEFLISDQIFVITLSILGLRNFLVFLTTLIICAVFVLLMVSLKSPSTCSPGYTLNQDLQKCYKVFRNLQTSNEAYGKCLQENGLIASIHDQKTNDFLADLYKHNDTKPLEDVKEFWIGLVIISGNWSWVDGKAVDWLNWDVGMPEKNLTGRSVVVRD